LRADDKSGILQWFDRLWFDQLWFSWQRLRLTGFPDDNKATPMKYSSNLRSRIALFVLAPGILCALLIGVYLAYALIRDIAQYEKQMGNAYSEQMASQAFSALQTGNTASLENTARLALEYPLLHAITFYDAQKQELAHAGPRHALPDNFPGDTELFKADKVELEADNSRQVFVPIVQPRLASSLMEAIKIQCQPVGCSSNSRTVF
jgi:hypothetical protein